MLKNLRIIIAVCFIVVPVLLTVAAVNQSQGSDEVVVLGVVNPSGQLVADDGQTFYIEQNEAGKALALLADHKVSVKGVVTGEADKKIINANTFEEVK